MNVFNVTRKLLTDDVTLSEGSEVKTIVHQVMLYDGMMECRCFCSDGKVYACLMDHEMKITKFVEVPPLEKK